MKAIIEKVTLQGFFKAKIYRAGKLIEVYESKNLITNVAKITMAQLLAGETAGKSITKIGFGTNSADPTVTDISLTNQFTKSISGFLYPEPGTVLFNWELLVTENNGMAICEFGLITDNGTLFARRSRENPINKASDISIEGSWAIKFLN